MPIVPERTKRAEGWDVRVARWDSSDVVVGSSMKTSSKRVVFWMAVSMEGVGVVTTSPMVGRGQMSVCKRLGKDGWGGRSGKATHCESRKQHRQDPPRHFASCTLPEPVQVPLRH